MPVVATSQTAIELISLVFIVVGFGFCAVLWWFMVVRGGREERRATAAASERDQRGGPDPTATS